MKYNECQAVTSEDMIVLLLDSFNVLIPILFFVLMAVGALCFTPFFWRTIQTLPLFSQFICQFRTNIPLCPSLAA